MRVEYQMSPSQSHALFIETNGEDPAWYQSETRLTLVPLPEGSEKDQKKMQVALYGLPVAILDGQVQCNWLAPDDTLHLYSGMDTSHHDTLSKHRVTGNVIWNVHVTPSTLLTALGVWMANDIARLVIEYLDMTCLQDAEKWLRSTPSGLETAQRVVAHLESFSDPSDEEEEDSEECSDY